jgi:hypothetical protein
MESKIRGFVRIRGVVWKGKIVITCDDMSTETLYDGSFEFPQVKAGQHTVTAQVRGYKSQSKSVEVSADEGASVDFDLVEEEGTAKIYGYVYDGETGKPITQGHLSLNLPIANKYVDIDGKGYYEFTNLRPDTYDIWVVPRGRFEEQKVCVTLKEGEVKRQDFQITKPPKWMEEEHPH